MKYSLAVAAFFLACATTRAGGDQGFLDGAKIDFVSIPTKILRSTPFLIEAKASYVGSKPASSGASGRKVLLAFRALAPDGAPLRSCGQGNYWLPGMSGKSAPAEWKPGWQIEQKAKYRCLENVESIEVVAELVMYEPSVDVAAGPIDARIQVLARASMRVIVESPQGEDRAALEALGPDLLNVNDAAMRERLLREFPRSSYAGWIIQYVDPLVDATGEATGDLKRARYLSKRRGSLMVPDSFDSRRPQILLEKAVSERLSILDAFIDANPASPFRVEAEWRRGYLHALQGDGKRAQESFTWMADHAVKQKEKDYYRKLSESLARW